MSAEAELSRSLLAAFRPDFAEREATALQLAGLLLDAIGAALPLTTHAPAAHALRELDALAADTDLYAWEGAPGWDVVLERGLRDFAPLPPGGPVLEGLGLRATRVEQRGELKKRARALASRLIGLGREAARFTAGAGSSSALALDEAPTLEPAAAVVAAHAALLRLCGVAAVFASLSLPEDAAAGELPRRSGALLEELEGRELSTAQDEWFALLCARNPAVAEAPLFRTLFAGLSQTLRAAAPLLRLREGAPEPADVEAVLSVVGGWQPLRWSALRSGAPAAWLRELCPPAPGESPQARLAHECDGALDALSRLWSAEGASTTAFATLYAVVTARCAAAFALWEELANRPLRR